MGSGWWGLLVIVLTVLGIHFIKRAETGEEVNTLEYYDYVMEQIEIKVEEQKTHEIQKRILVLTGFPVSQE